MRIYIGNISFRTTDDDLYRLVTPYGRVTFCQIKRDRESGRSKGFGFVAYEKGEHAKKAIKELDGAELLGRALVVREAVPSERFKNASKS